MSARDHDHLPQTSAVSALIRRIVFRLNAELHFHKQVPLSDTERAAFFDLGLASKILDGVACLPGMAQHEERARRDLLELYDIFDRTLPANAPAARLDGLAADPFGPQSDNRVRS